MLMLTHTWILRELFRRAGRIPPAPDAYIYNVAPDLLTIHPEITSAVTHGVPRLAPLPPADARGAYVQFHLIVDDMAHYGRIGMDSPGEFDPSAGGYSYRQGRSLVSPLEELHRRVGRAISADEALYRAHMMVEMAFDLNLYLRGNGSLLDLFLEALEYTAGEGLAGFAGTLSRMTGIPEGKVAEAVARGRDTYDRRRMEGFMSQEGRAALFIDKFHLERDDGETGKGVGQLMGKALEITEDSEGFLETVLASSGEAGFRLPP
jgi:hypothetical protein